MLAFLIIGERKRIVGFLWKGQLEKEVIIDSPGSSEQNDLE